MSSSVCLFIQHVCICTFSELSSLTSGMQVRESLPLPRKPPVCRSNRCMCLVGERWAACSEHEVQSCFSVGEESLEKTTRGLSGLLEPASHS